MSPTTTRPVRRARRRSSHGGERPTAYLQRTAEEEQKHRSRAQRQGGGHRQRRNHQTAHRQLLSRGASAYGQPGGSRAAPRNNARRLSSSLSASTPTRGLPADYYENPPVRGRAEQQTSSLTTMTADGQFCEYCSRNHPGPMSMRCCGINPPAGNTERIRHAEALQAKWRARKHP